MAKVVCAPVFYFANFLRCRFCFTAFVLRFLFYGSCFAALYFEFYFSDYFTGLQQLQQV